MKRKVKNGWSLRKIGILVGAVLVIWGIINFAIILIPREVEVLFVGDMMFDRYVRQVAEKKGGDFIFCNTGEILNRADLVVGNLEGPITDKISVSVGSEAGSYNNFIFTFPPSTAKLLKKHNIDLVNLGNNHISNFGQPGIVSTKKYLDKAGVDYFGGVASDEPVYQTQIGGNKFSFISYNQFGGSPFSKIVAKIKDEKKDDRTVIVFAHWGEEYLPATWNQKNLAKLFAEAGASAIIGSHPHIVQEHESINDTPVYYSLGNFIFDQYWYESVREGLALEMNFKDNKITEIKEHSIVLNKNGQTCLDY